MSVSNQRPPMVIPSTRQVGALIGGAEFEIIGGVQIGEHVGRLPAMVISLTG